MRVLHIINGEHYAGAERVQDLLAIELRKHGYDVDFACVKPDCFPDRRMATRSKIHLVRMSSRLDLLQAFRLSFLIRKHGYQLVHTHTPRAVLLGRLATLLTGVPMVHHVHSPTSSCTTNKLTNFLRTTSERLSLCGAQSVIAVSNSLKQYLKKNGLKTTQIQVVQNGVPVQPKLLQKSNPDSDSAWLLGCIALFRPRKGLEVLLKTLAQLKARGLDVSLHAVGEFETTEYENSVKQLATQLGLEDNIVWAGFQEDVNAELSKMDVLVLPSLFGEGIPMVLLEAMAMGVPVVASEIEGIPEVIENARSGILVSPGDFNELADAITNLITGQDNWGKIRETAFSRQRDSFSDRSMAAGVAQIYDNILKTDVVPVGHSI
ncbi:MAG: glycosyltransferase [Synechococcus sp.]